MRFVDHTEKFGSEFLCRILCHLLVFFLATHADSALATESVYRIGVLANRGAERCLAEWEPTAHYLSQKLAPDRFEIVPLDFDGIRTAIDQRTVEYVVANPSYFPYITSGADASILAIRQVLAPYGSDFRFGGAIVARADRTDLIDLSSLQGKRFAAVHPDSLGGWHAAWLVMQRLGISPEKHLSEVVFAGDHDGVIEKILDGRVDAGTVRSTHIERMLNEGSIPEHTLKLLHDTSADHPNYPYWLSTDLYPEWPFTALLSDDPERNSRIAIALLSIPSDHPAAISMNGAGWVTPYPYDTVNELLQELKLPPYEQVPPVQFGVFLRHYWPLHLSVLVTIGLSLYFFLYYYRSSRLLQAALNKASQAQSRFEEVAEHTRTVTWETDADGRYTYVSATSLAILEYRPDELLGKHFSFLHPSGGREAFRNRAESLLGTHRPFQNIEKKTQAKSGRVVWMSTSGMPAIGVNRQFEGYRGSAVDITKRKEAEETTARKTKELDRYFSISLDLFCIANVEGRFLRLNPQWEDTLGYAIDELEGQSFLEFVHPNDYQATIDTLQSLAAQQEVASFENRYRCKDGSYRWIEWRSRPDGDMIYAAARDVTNRKLLEQSLRHERSRFEWIIRAIKAGTWEWNMQTGESTFNEEWAGMIGYTLEELSPTSIQTLEELIHPDDLAKRTQLLQSHFDQTSPVYQAEMRMRHRDGHWVWIWDRGQVIRWGDDGAPERMAGIRLDISEQKAKDAKLRQLAQAIEQIPISIVITDTRGDILYVNPYFEKASGYSCDEVLGQNPRILKADTASEVDYTELWDTIKGGQSWQGEFQNKRKNGSVYYERALIAPVHDENNSIAHFVAIKEDITGHKQAAEQRERLEGLLAQSNRMESVGRLAGGVAHDFNNMLSVILGHVEMAMEKFASEDALHAHLVEMRHAAQRSADLTRQLLTFARKQAAVPKVINLNEAVESILKMLRRLIGEHVELSWHPEADLWPIRIDPVQLDQVLVNLTVNARDAIGSSGSVTIRTRNVVFQSAISLSHSHCPPGDYVKLAVEDTGCGMDSNTLASIFEPFFTMKEQGKGTGLGLATVFGVVTQNHGHLDVASSPGEGSIFRMFFPRDCGAAHEEELRNELDDGQRVMGVQGERILLVEDELPLLKATTMMLERLGYTVYPASSAEDALRKVVESQIQFELLLTDLIMPEMNGKQLAEKILTLHPDVKLMFMSGYTAEVIGSHGLLDEHTVLLQKPFSMAELGKSVRALMDDK